MQDFAALLGILAALSVGVVSPGPSFVMIARTAMSVSRADGLAAAIGMGAGGVLFAIAALLGLQGVLLALPSLYIGLKIVGGLYLAYLGWRIWAGARQPLAMTETPDGARPATPWKSLAMGFTTQVSNPKTTVVYASVFVAFLPPTQTLAFDFILLALVFVVEAGWYAVVALALSAERPRNAYLRYKTWMDRVAGGVMMALGLKLVWSAERG